MKRVASLWIVIGLCAGLSLWGCGDDGDGDGDTGNSGNSGNTGNSGSGNGGGGAACTDVCNVLTACPAGFVDAASCPSICEQMMSAGCRDCIAASMQCGVECANTCSGMGGGGGGGGMNGGGGMGTGGGGGPSGGGIGQGCQFNSDCASEICVGGGIQDGYCSQTCTSFSDCPDFWDCEGNPDGPGQICLNNG